ncbi:S9 family peptidase [Niabella drilacis]|uniref:Dipeptidyl aminopeptidase/acylaminoacyl peptidase n=1 Tax=Niabella drilacis (strain DSM 25811 / CCM 8410 / CCUG 62505 / LMG 26954 / E90) TaxID=1285928 RepID=A0A1G6S547_NIADE|nr:DPP IV N-terminal domain-containing protein [Niabella drilacis]SDD11326.1 Dipeptidyl aminopeptidase/acylaminoacyl peptidase [Niabella drilacis]
MKQYCTLFLLLTIVSSLKAQQVTRQDYARAVSFIYSNLVNKKIFNTTTPHNWFADSTGLSFLTQDKSGKVFYKLDWKKMKPERMFDHERLAKLLSDSLKKEVSATDLPLTAARYADKTHIDINAAGKDYILDLNTYTIVRKHRPENRRKEGTSPDGKWVAYTKDHNLFVRSTATGEVKQLSKDGAKHYEYATYYGWGELIEGENGERPPHFSVNWSPDSKWIQAYICDLRKAEKMYLLDWSIDTLYKPKLLSYYRGSPGDTNMIYMTPVFFNIATGEMIRKDAFRNVNAASCDWSREPGIAYIKNLVRGYQQVDLFRLDLTTGTQDNVYSETSATNIDNYNSYLTKDPAKILFTSEKSGWKQVYLLNPKSKSVTPITNGAFYVNDLLFLDEKAQVLFFTASGKEAGRNPYYQHLYRVKLDGTGLTLLTPENANHDITVSPDGKYFTDNISTLDQAPVFVLRDSKNGRIIAELNKANIDALLAMNYHFPEAFTATGRDGVTTIYGALWKPTNFDPAKKYPVIDQTYTGPHTFMFPQNFVSSISRSNQALAELGFIVITVDGLGTANRSKAFHNVSYKNMGKNLTDHVLAIRELGKKYSWMDTDRVGIFGHSAGGYDAGHAVLEFPDFYKVAVASSADHDFRMEKDWWPEMYMGWPVDSTYEQVSNITMAGNLKGKLLIVHGGIDENVNPSATFKLAEALVKADKDFDMLILPSQHHGYVGKYNDYFTKKKWNYFVEHLLGLKPIWEFEMK